MLPERVFCDKSLLNREMWSIWKIKRQEWQRLQSNELRARECWNARAERVVSEVPIESKVNQRGKTSDRGGRGRRKYKRVSFGSVKREGGRVPVKPAEWMTLHKKSQWSWRRHNSCRKGNGTAESVQWMHRWRKGSSRHSSRSQGP